MCPAKNMQNIPVWLNTFYKILRTSFETLSQYLLSSEGEYQGYARYFIRLQFVYK